MDKIIIEGEIIPSTQLYLKENLQLLKEDTITIIKADLQLNAKGRNDKVWFSPTGGLWFSFAFYLKNELKEQNSLSQIIALTICQILENEFKILPQIKWPNDVMLNDRKLAGILTEIINYKNKKVLLCGVGINTNFSNLKILEIKSKIFLITLYDFLGYKIDNKKLLIDFINNFEKNFEKFCKAGYSFFKEEILNRDYLLGKDVIVKVNKKSKKEGKVISYSEEGYLKIKNKKNMEEIIYAGEVIIK
ncbi:MAG TPA: biotin--[acetyl-CoA-carboxylase] ligase [bacterium]|nr:biotin--[acetyl-CoA-carboxylase] ligase [bacterium]HOL47229.1 biotin--[acetyl-CoA-carboxylase] ligase [bacterium]HPQ18262.1 biotin--[acetyl-CoA-carboxylase] ligase [bacterium]